MFGVGWGSKKLYNAWSRPTLAQSLKIYQNLSDSLEPLYEQWCHVADEFDTIAPYYRLLWADNAVNSLQILVQRQGAVLPALTPLEWHLTTGGKVELKYELRLSGVGKRAQLASAEKSLQELAFPRVASVTWQEGDLADIESLPIASSFQLLPATYEKPPAPCVALGQAVTNIRSRIASVLDYSLTQTETVNLALTRLIGEAFSADQMKGQDWIERVENTVDPGALLDDMGQQLTADGRPVPLQLRELRKAWTGIAEQRWPWRRSELDNASLRDDIRDLETLVNSDLPPVQLLHPLSARFQVLHRALLNGYSERDVFDDRKAALRLESEVLHQVGALPIITIERPTVASDLLSTQWELTLNASVDSKAGFAAPDVLAALLRIGNMHAGFVVQSVRLHFRLNPQSDFEVERCIAKGLLAVRAEEDIPHEKLAFVTDGNM